MDKLKLMHKVLSGQADREEQTELELWLSGSDGNKAEFEDVKLLFETERAEIQGEDNFQTGFNEIRSIVQQRNNTRRRRRHVLLTSIVTFIAAISFLLVENRAHQNTKGEGLTFHDASLAEVIRQLEKGYDIKIVVVNRKLLNCRFNGTFYRIESKEDIFAALENSLSVKVISLTGKRYELAGKGCLSL